MHWSLSLIHILPIIDRFDVPDGYLPATESRAKVFQFVETELKDNIDNLSEDRLNTYGRFNKWNAKMLLARMYLNAEAWIGTPKYSECEALCDEIILANKYRLDGDYSLPFSTNNELSNETMFVIPFDETKSGGQIYMWARKTLHYSQMQTFSLQSTWPVSYTHLDVYKRQRYSYALEVYRQKGYTILVLPKTR